MSSEAMEVEKEQEREVRWKLQELELKKPKVDWYRAAVDMPLPAAQVDNSSQFVSTMSRSLPAAAVDDAAHLGVSTKKMGKSPNWDISLLEKLSEAHLLAPVSRRIQKEKFSHVEARLSECFKATSTQAKFFDQPVSVALLTPENVEMVLALWLSSDEHEVVLEAVRIRGESAVFHGYCHHILDAFSGNFDKSKLSTHEKTLEYHKLLEEKLRTGISSEAEMEIEPVFEFNMGIHDTIQFANREESLLYLQSMEEDRGAESHNEMEEDTFFGLKTIRDLLTMQEKDSKRRGMEELCHLADASKTVLFSAILVSRVLLLGDGQQPVSQELRDMLLGMTQDGITIEGAKTTGNYLEVDDYRYFPEYSEEKLLGLQALANTVEVAATFGLDEAVGKFLDYAQQNKDIDILEMLLQTLRRAKLKLHLAWLAARSLRFICQASPKALQWTKEKGGSDVAGEACDVGRDHHAKLESECRLLLEVLSTKINSDGIVQDKQRAVATKGYSEAWREVSQQAKLESVRDCQSIDEFIAAFQPALTGILAPEENTEYVTKHDDLREKIEELQTVEKCSRFYDKASYQECIRLIRSARQEYKEFLAHRGMMLNDITAQERFAKHWAIELSKDKEWARALNHCRKTALMLLYKVCDLSYSVDGSSPTVKFHPEKIYQILIHCLVMDRANTLYNMNGGQGWYSRKDEPEYLYGRLLPLNKNPKGKASINKRLRECYDDTLLDLKQDPAIRKWMEWKAPLRFAQQEQEVRQKLVELRERLQNEEEVQEFLFLEQFKDLEVAGENVNEATSLEVAKEDGVSRPKRSRTQQG